MQNMVGIHENISKRCYIVWTMKKETETLVAMSMRDNFGILFKKTCRDIKFSLCKNLSNNTDMLPDHDAPRK